MKAFVKRNFVLVLGVSLPLLLIAVFGIMKGITQLVDPPAYKPVLAFYNLNYAQGELDFDVSKSGTLQATYTQKDQVTQNLSRTTNFQIFVFDTETELYDTYILRVSGEGEIGEALPVEIPRDLAAVKIIPGETAPDGYKVVPYNRSRGNLFTEIFGFGGDYYTRWALKKEGRTIPITIREGYYQDLELIGWVEIGTGDDR